MKQASKLIILLSVIFFSLTEELPLYALTEDGLKEKELLAISFYRQRKNKEAIKILLEIINAETEMGEQDKHRIREAYYWLGKAYLKSGDFQSAKKSFEFYLANFKTSGANYEDAFYENAMMYYTEKKYQTAAQLFSNFLKDFPESKDAAKVCYQAGESLYELTLYEDAEIYFQTVINNYTDSPYYEAATFRIKLIESRKNELVLQNLLKWSQEQFLAHRDLFRKKEKEAEDTIRTLENKLLLMEDYYQLKEENVLLKQQMQEKRQTDIKLPANNSESSSGIIEKKELLKRKEIILKMIEIELGKGEKK